MRNSDPDAAVYWLARMLEAGEDVLYVARRLVRFASEDVGNADPQALAVAVAAKEAAHFLGHARGQHRPRAGGHLPGDGAEEQRRLPRLRAGGRRRARDVAEPVPLHLRNAPDAPDEDARLRQGLPVRARRARRRRPTWTACRRR
jgi:putative ATPase